MQSRYVDSSKSTVISRNSHLPNSYENLHQRKTSSSVARERNQNKDLATSEVSNSCEL